jgi:hypothetical protein
MRTGIVIVRPTYRMSELESSLMAVMKLINAPATIPGSISGSVMRRKAEAGDAPSETAASSMLPRICFRIDALERTAIGQAAE